MRYLKIALSIIALAVGAISGCGAAGLIIISAAAISFLQAVSMALATFGVQVFAVGASLARTLGAVSLLIAAGLGLHGGFLTTATVAHAWIGILIKVVGFVGIVLGFIGRNPSPPAQSAAAKLDAPVPAGK
jgi:hypothetical protein